MNRETTMTGPRRRVRAAGLAASTLALVAVLAAGATAATSAKSSAPENSAPPSVSGTFRVGESVTATTGSWQNSPNGYSYQWRRCNDAGSGCADVSGATAKTYKLAQADTGHTIVVAVTAANADGKATAASKPSPVVSDSTAPRNTGRPALSGTAQVGQVLHVSNGTWTGGVRSYAYRWQRCDKDGNNCAAVPGATAASYGVRAADVGLILRAGVTAANGAGQTTVDTDRSGTVQPAAGVVFKCPSGTSVAASDLQAPVRLQIDRFQFAPVVVTRGTQTVTARYHVADTCGRSVVGAELWSTAIPYNQVSTQRGTTGGDGWGTLTFSVSGGFPAAPKRQEILAFLVRATKPGGSVLAGVSARRVVRENVDLRR
jgi:hypothetical protein